MGNGKFDKFVDLVNAQFDLSELLTYLRHYLETFLRNNRVPIDTKRVYREKEMEEHLIALVSRKYGHIEGAQMAARGLTELDSVEKELKERNVEEAMVFALRASRLVMSLQSLEERNRILASPRPYRRMGETSAQEQKRHFSEKARVLANLYEKDNPNWNREGQYLHVAAELQKTSGTSTSAGRKAPYPSSSTVKKWLLSLNKKP